MKDQQDIMNVVIVKDYYSLIYEPISYWKAQGKDYYKNFTYTDQFVLQERKLFELLHTLKFNSVLELGCGWGRITQLLYYTFKPKKYTAIDISPDQLAIAKKKCPNGVKFIEADIHSLYSPKPVYDLVIAVEVLMHIPPPIQNIIDRMISWSNQHVINLDYTGDEELHFHNFKHDYHNLYHYNVTEIRLGNQSIFHLDKLFSL